MEKQMMDIQIRQRPWWMWTLAVVWLFLEILIAQSAIGSGIEHETRAALILWILFVVIAIAGALVWVLRDRAR